MKTIELFEGPLDGLKFEAKANHPDTLEFGYAKTDSTNYKLEQTPVTSDAPLYSEYYERTNETSTNDHIIYRHNRADSRIPT